MFIYFDVTNSNSLKSEKYIHPKSIRLYHEHNTVLLSLLLHPAPFIGTLELSSIVAVYKMTFYKQISFFDTSSKNEGTFIL